MPESVAAVDCDASAAENESGDDAETVWESETGDSDLEADEPVSEVMGEYFRWSGGFDSIVRTRLFVLAATTLAV
jgi:hypothetical protein